jgi:curved DNA-binding protein CbpA
MADDYYSILGVPRNASQSQIKQAYLHLARVNHPDRFHDPAEQSEAARRFQAISESYNHLRDEKLRREYDRSLERQMSPVMRAQLYYENAQLRELGKDYDEALKLYYEAMQLDPQTMTYVVAAAQLLGRDRSRQRQAAELLHQALEKNPQAREVYLELGALYSRSGLLQRARRVYEDALRQFPTDDELHERLSAVSAAAERPRGR